MKEEGNEEYEKENQIEGEKVISETSGSLSRSKVLEKRRYVPKRMRNF